MHPVQQQLYTLCRFSQQLYRLRPVLRPCRRPMPAAQLRQLPKLFQQHLLLMQPTSPLIRLGLLRQLPIHLLLQHNPLPALRKGLPRLPQLHLLRFMPRRLQLHHHPRLLLHPRSRLQVWCGGQYVDIHVECHGDDVGGVSDVVGGACGLWGDVVDIL